MLLTKLKSAMLVLLVGMGVVGSGGVLYRMQAAEPVQPGVQPMAPLTVADENAQAETEELFCDYQERK